MSKTQPARGMRDFLPADIRKREYVIGIIKEVYESYGFEPLETPAVENLETLTGKYGEEGNQLIFKILKRGEKLDEALDAQNPQSAIRNPQSLSDLALRYDLTVPLARVVANYKNDLPKFFKRYQIQPVWRADRPARGRFREFYQCDVDAIGSSSMTVEAEIILAECEILGKLGFEDFIIRINNRKFLTGVLTLKGVPSEKHTDALIALDKLDKIGETGVLSEFLNRGINKEVSESVIQGFKIFAKTFEIMVAAEKIDQINYPGAEFRKTYFEKFLIPFLDNVKTQVADSPEACEAIEELKEITKPIKSYEAGARIKFDFSLARGLSYYTGTIMEINVPDLVGSLGGGGRYDGLIGMFGKEQIPACGFSLGLERILVVMEERGMFPPEIAESNAADVMVTIWNEESVADSLALAQELRAQGLRVLLYPEADKIGKQLKYAGQINVPYVIVQGDEEKASDTINLKNMQTGDQEIIKPENVAEKIERK